MISTISRFPVVRYEPHGVHCRRRVQLQQLRIRVISSVTGGRIAVNRVSMSTRANNDVHESFHVSSAAASSLYSAVQSRRNNANREPLAYHPKGYLKMLTLAFLAAPLRPVPSEDPPPTTRDAERLRHCAIPLVSLHWWSSPVAVKWVEFLYPSSWVVPRSLGRGAAAELNQNVLSKGQNVAQVG